MPYQPNIPQPATAIRISQNDLLVNFQQILATFQVNHAAFNGATPGRHAAVQFVQQAADPATAANEFALYAKNSILTGQLELFTRRANSGQVVSITESVAATPGYTRTSSGMLIQWGTDVAAAGAQIKVLPAPMATILAMWFTIQTAGGVDANRFIELNGPFALNTYNIFAGVRNANNVAGACNYYYVAIGF